ncbi:MAG: hypothetical protein ACKV2T_21945 [Kofleriaceae bacterium]
MFPDLKLRDRDEEWVDPWPQCVDPNMYDVPDSIDTTPIPSTDPNPSKWPTLDFGDDEAPPIGPLPAPEPGSVDWWNDGLDPKPEPTLWDDIKSDLGWLVDMF